MKLFEYQAKEAFREKGLPTPKGVLVRGMDELDGAFAEVGFPCVLKSQVLSGGRGKAGLIKVVKDAESAKATAKTLFESEHNVRMLLVEEAVDIDREIYLSITVDPVESKIMLIGCAEGGVEIEKLAATDPDKIVTVRVDIAEGLGGYHVNNLTYGMGLSGDLGKQVGAVVRGLYKTFRAYDAQLAEINPLFITKDGKAIAGDGKLIIDDNSVWRQPSYPLTRDYFDSEVEFEAAQEGIPYLQFNGDIALMLRGRGPDHHRIRPYQRRGRTPGDLRGIRRGQLHQGRPHHGTLPQDPEQGYPRGHLRDHRPSGRHGAGPRGSDQGPPAQAAHRHLHPRHQ